MTRLINRLYQHQELPTSRFAFQGTMNWMRALAIITTNGSFDNRLLRAFYQPVQRRHPNEEFDTLAFGYLLMALHNCASLDKLATLDEPYSCVRSAIVAWYYSLYYSSKAMIAAANGADPQTHADTAKLFQTEMVDRRLLVHPFNLSISNLTPTNINDVSVALRAGNTFDLNVQPTNDQEAIGGIISYLKGTAEYRREEIEEKVRLSREFTALGLTSFRSNAAKQLRDIKLEPASVNILTEAFRYRGKANYRDAIYLSYGAGNAAVVAQFSVDLSDVASAFVNMAAHYISKRVTHQNWSDFSQDIIDSARFVLPIDLTLA